MIKNVVLKINLMTYPFIHPAWAEEDQKKGIGSTEIWLFFSIWFGSGVLIALIWFLDGQFDIQIGYDNLRAFCFITKDEGFR